MMFVARLFSVSALLMLTIAQPLTAQGPQSRQRTTSISIKGMHCQSCAKKVVKLLQKVGGVSKANVDAKKGLATVVPVGGPKLPSPRAQWEAVVKAGYKPLRLAGPFGVFTTKPRF